MSMTSAQIDELRELATRYDELQVGAVKAVTMPSDMGSILHEAADTIWQLRDDLQRANGLLADAEHDESRAWDRVRKAEAEADRLRSCLSDDAENARQIMGENRALKAENAKLRGLVRDLYEMAYPECPSAFEAAFADRMRELGIEVDG